MLVFIRDRWELQLTHKFAAQIGSWSYRTFYGCRSRPKGPQVRLRKPKRNRGAMLSVLDYWPRTLIFVILGLDCFWLPRSPRQGKGIIECKKIEYNNICRQYSAMKWTQEHFTGIAKSLEASAQNWYVSLPGVDWDEISRKSAVYKIVGPGHKGWSKRVDGELGNCELLQPSELIATFKLLYRWLSTWHWCSYREGSVDTFLSNCIRFRQIDFRHPDVRKDFLSWSAWILEVRSTFDHPLL